MFYNKNCVYNTIIMFKYNNIIHVSCVIRFFKHYKKNIIYPIKLVILIKVIIKCKLFPIMRNLQKLFNILNHLHQKSIHNSVVQKCYFFMYRKSCMENIICIRISYTRFAYSRNIYIYKIIYHCLLIKLALRYEKIIGIKQIKN